LTWEPDREKRRQEALERHQRLSTLFREDRLTFERERQRMIDEIIDSAGDDGLKARLISMQSQWNRRMRGAGSPNNRLVLAKSFFWDHFHRVWQPAIEKMHQALQGPAD